ncbi:MAG: hypothetical protein WCG85_28345 [Polyangia bacterium]
MRRSWRRRGNAWLKIDATSAVPVEVDVGRHIQLQRPPHLQKLGPIQCRKVASQGTTIDEARVNLIEALELFFETADASEIQNRMHSEVFVTRLEVAVG